MKRKVVIVGAGGTGRELAALIPDVCDLRGFLDDRVTGNQILGKTGLISTLAVDHLFAGTVGSYRSMDARRKILANITPETAFSYIHPRAFIYPGVKMAPGHLIFPGTVLSTGVTLDEHILIYHNSVISHDTHIGRYSIIANGVVISGQVKVGMCTYIGSGATVIEGCNIGNHCIIAAGSTVITDVPDHTTWLGPGRMVENKYHKDQG